MTTYLEAGEKRSVVYLTDPRNQNHKLAVGRLQVSEEGSWNQEGWGESGLKRSKSPQSLRVLVLTHGELKDSIPHTPRALTKFSPQNRRVRLHPPGKKKKDGKTHPLGPWPSVKKINRLFNCLKNRVRLCSPGWPKTHKPPASAFKYWHVQLAHWLFKESQSQYKWKLSSASNAY